MDLRLIPGAVPTPAESEAIDSVLGSPATFLGPSMIGRPGSRPDAGPAGSPAASSDHGAHGGLHQAQGRRHLLLPALHAVQARCGSIGAGALNAICARLDVPPAEAYGVASFYAMLALEPRPASVVHVCDDIACRVNGAESLCRDLVAALGPAGAPPAGARAGWLRSPCLGLCERAPAVLFQCAGERGGESVLAPADPARVVALLKDAAGGSGPPRITSPPARASAPQAADAGTEGLRLLRRVGRVDPQDLDAYRAHGGYAALRRALALGAEGVIREVLDSRLVGRGGAAFPTGRKWDAVAKAAARPHYLVCNADESEPGTFKDRVLMEEDPFAVVEAMTIAGFAAGCARGYIYVRGEYPLAAARISGAIAQARARGLLGAGVMGSGAVFDIEVRRGAGAYICGEETALFNSIEGLRGEPRNKPPFPTQSGLFGKPTLVNNVETLANVLPILIEGGPAFAALGTPESAGTKLFCVSGRAARPGVYEVPFGTTLGQLLDRAGGVRGGRPLRTILLGGAAGFFVTPDNLDVPLTFEGTRAAGATLGSGVVMVFDDGVDLVDTVLRIAAFFRDESCGQCVPCRVGTERQEEALRRLAAGRPLGSVAAETALIDEIGQAMRDASICGLGQTAAGAVQSAIRRLGLFGGAAAGPPPPAARTT